jgi:glucosylceramidase
MTYPGIHLRALSTLASLALAACSTPTQNSAATPAPSPSLQWICSTETARWQPLPATVLPLPSAPAPAALQLDPQTTYQTIDGFGGCFNELGWTALQALDPAGQATALQALFAPGGCNFNLCRVGIGANDFALNWYSLDESPGDFTMAHFTIERDRQYLIPYIKAAMQYQPNLAIWGVPWCPPSWMTTSGQYFGGHMKDDSQTLAAYALYFSKYVQAYREEGINLYAIHPQNEPLYNDSKYHYPQCAWNGTEIDTFLRDYLVPQLKKDHVDVQVWLGTMVSKNMAAYTDPVLGDPATNPSIAGVGYQYNGQNLFLATHQKYPDKKMLETETECYHGENTWTQAMTTFGKIIQDLNHFANGYTFWNMILSEKATSSWGWKQNSLLIIDAPTKTIVYNPEFYSLKHVSHFVQPGASRIGCSITSADTALNAAFTDRTAIAFRNPSGELVLVVANPGKTVQPLTIQSGHSTARVDLPASSMNTFVLTNW